MKGEKGHEVKRKGPRDGSVVKELAPLSRGQSSSPAPMSSGSQLPVTPPQKIDFLLTFKGTHVHMHTQTHAHA